MRHRVTLLVLPAAMFLAFCMVLPVAQLLSLAFSDNRGAISFSQFTRLFSSGTYVQVLFITFRIAAWATLISIVVSYPVAYLMANCSDRTRRTLTFWVLLPFWTSFLVRTFAWLVLLGREGPVNTLLQAVHLTDAPISLLFNFTGVMIGLVHAFVPMCVMTMLSVMAGIDANLSKAAQTLGARNASAFWQIYLPLSLPGVAAGGLLVFVTCLGFFITPALLGGRRETMITQVIIDEIQQLLNWPFASALALVLLVATLIVFYLYDRVVGLSSLGGVAARSVVQREIGCLARIGKRAGFLLLDAIARISDIVGETWDRFSGPFHGFMPPSRVLSGLVILVLVVLSLPAFIMIPISFTEGSIVDWPPRGFSFKWYTDFFNSPLWMGALLRSLSVAVLSSLLAMLLGLPAAIALVRGSVGGRTAMLAFILSPLLIPRIIIAVALFYLFAKIGLVGTTIGLVIGHTILALPYVVITLMAVLRSYDERLDQAAMILGATRIETLRLVTLPLIRLGLLSAGLFAFITSLDELTIALFVTGGLATTLPKQMWDEAILKVTPTVAAASTLLLLLISLIVVLSEWIKRRSEVSGMQK